MGKGPEQTFFQRRHTTGQQVHEKIFNVTNHQENTIKTMVRYHSTYVKWPLSKSKEKEREMLTGICRKGNPEYCW